MKLRVKFSKQGAVKYIGHLDVMRYFQKTLRRAEVDIKYTTGYSPHQVMSFAQPLGVGLTSLGEYMDIELNSDCADLNKLKEQIKACSVPGIQVLNIIELPENAGNAMASVAAALYKISFKEGKVPEGFNEQNNLTKCIADYLNQDKIIIEKEGKAGKREVDIKPGIYKFAYDEGSKSFELFVNASSEGNIKPLFVIDTFLQTLNLSLPANALSILRLDTFTHKTKDSTEIDDLVPMDKI